MGRRFFSMILALCLALGLLPPEALADFDPMPGGTGILGQVLDEKTGQPPESVTAVLRYDDESSGVITVDEQKAVDSDGKFQFTYHNEGGEFPAGNYTLTFTSPFYLTETVPIQIAGTSESRIIQQYLTPGGSVFGTVADAETGAALGGVAVKAVSGGEVRQTAETDESGQYRLELEAGEYTVEFSKENYQTGTLTRALGPGTEAHIGAEDERLTLGSGGNVEIVASGDCSAYSRGNVTWTLDNNGLLVISGEGAMINCDSSASSVPWYNWRDQIDTVILESGVTNIGWRAFYGCSSLSSITLPSSVTSIGSYAFIDCSSLSSISIPSGVTSIGGYAFYGCSSLSSITIPSGVTSIGDRTFHGCSSLSGISLPSGITSIGSGAFGYCSSLSSISLPSGVTSIGNSAFSGCSSLSSISLPSGVTSIGGAAFYGCSSLKDVYYGGSESQWRAIEIDSSYNYCLTSATIHYNSAGPKEGFCISANTATTCLKKGTTFEMDVAYFKNDTLDLTAKEFIAVSGNSNVLGITAGSWDDATGRRYIVTAKQAGSGSITFTNPSDGQANKIDFTVIDGESGYTFDRVPKMTIEKDKTTNFYNFCGMVVDDFAYTPHEDESGVIDYYDVTMTVYNSKNLYGTVASYQSNGEVYEFAVIDKHSDFSTSIVGDLKELKDSIGDLFYLLENEKYYSGKSISKETPVSIRVPVGGYLQVSNSLSSETAAAANVIGLLVDGSARVTGLISSSGGLVDKTSNITDAVLNESMKTLEEVFADDFLKKQVSGELKGTVQKSFKNGTWNLDNYGDCMQSFLSAMSKLGVDLAENIAKKLAPYDVSGTLSLTESVVKKVIPTGNLINFLYSTVGMADQSLFWLNFQASASFPSGIFIYAPSTENSYQSNGVSVTPAQKDNSVTVHAYRVVDTADISGNKYETYSVNMYRDGQKVQPDAPVSVQIPLRPSYNKGSVKVYRINDDGTATNMNATVENGYAVFTTDHFSYYALVDVDSNGVFLSRWTSDGSAVVTLSDPDEAAGDVIVYAAAYDDSGRMTDIMFGEKLESETSQIRVAFPKKLGEGWELYVLTPDHAPICPGMTLPAPSKG